MALPSFSEYYNTLKIVEKCLISNDGTLEGFFEKIEEADLNLETVMSSDMAQVTLPIGMLPSRKPSMVEVAPPDKNLEVWIKKMKPIFKKEYGENWQKVLYALAWKGYNKK